MSEFNKRLAAAAVGFGAGASFVAAVEGSGFHIGSLLPHAPNISLGHAQPPTAEASIEPDSYTLIEEFDMICTAKIGVETNVVAHDHQTFGSVNIKQRIEGDVEVCGDNNQLKTDVLVTHSEPSGAVTSVVGIFRGIQTNFARVDHTNIINCVGIGVNDTAAQEKAKIAAWEKKKAAGDKPGCARLIHVSGLGVSDSATRAEDLAWSVAQVDISIGANVPPAMTQSATNRIKNDMLDELRGEFPGAKDSLMDLSQTQTPVDQIMSNITADKSEFATFNRVEASRDKKTGGLVLKEWQPDGANATESFASPAHEVTDAEVTQINTRLQQILGASLSKAA